MSAFRLNFRPTGPISAAYLADRKIFSGIMGPIGSGKTSVSVIKSVLIAQEQAPSTLDGIRYTRGVVIRDTYRQLWKTTIPSWCDWIPKTVGDWHGGDGQPAKHHIRFDNGQGIIDMEVIFMALGDQAVEDMARGLEITWFWLNETDLCAPEVLTYMSGRAGRYPSKRHGGPTWYGGFGDFNAPDEDNYIADLLIYNKPDEYSFYRQPSGFSAKAENIENLPKNYYENQAAGKEDWYIRRMIRNEIGYSRDGKPVYPEFSDDLHMAPEPLMPVSGLEVAIGVDAGRTPAAIFGQKMPDGQVRWLAELVVEDAGAVKFGKLLIEFCEKHFPGCIFIGWGDPAADYKADHDESTWLEILSKTTGIRFRPAPCGNNDLVIRLEAVRAPMMRLIDGRPGFLLSPVCKVVRKGFNSGYKYKRILVSGGSRYGDRPDKNKFSHPHDAGQYLNIGLGEGRAVLQKRSLIGHNSRNFNAQTNFSVFGGR